MSTTPAALDDLQLGRDYSDAAETCCYDVWNNIKEAARIKPQSRSCTDEELNKISIRKVIFKQFLSTFLLAMIVWFITIEELEVKVEFGDLFDCDPDSETSIIVADDVANDFFDEGRSYCYFKSVMILLSFAFLLPFVLESLSVVIIIWISSINDEVLIPVAEGVYAGYDSIFNDNLSANPVYRLLNSWRVIYQVPLFIFGVARNSDTQIDMCTLFVEVVWKFFVFVAPDMMLTLALFPVSYYVMQSSGSADEIIVNLVAVQVFATLDEMFVKMLLRPRSSVGESIQNYLNENPKSTLAKYSPLEAYKLTINRHEWGVKVKGMTQMKELHDYDGFHFSP